MFFVIGPFTLALLGLVTCTAVPAPPAAAPPASPAPTGAEIPPLPVQPPTLARPTLTTTVYIVQFKQDLTSQQQAEFITAMEQRLHRRVEVLYRYETAYNGLAVILIPQEAQWVAEMEAVRQVQPDYQRSLQNHTALE